MEVEGGLALIFFFRLKERNECENWKHFELNIKGEWSSRERSRQRSATTRKRERESKGGTRCSRERERGRVCDESKSERGRSCCLFSLSHSSTSHRRLAAPLLKRGSPSLFLHPLSLPRPLSEERASFS